MKPDAVWEKSLLSALQLGHSKCIYNICKDTDELNLTSPDKRTAKSDGEKTFGKAVISDHPKTILQIVYEIEYEITVEFNKVEANCDEIDRIRAACQSNDLPEINKAKIQAAVNYLDKSLWYGTRWSDGRGSITDLGMITGLEYELNEETCRQGRQQINGRDQSDIGKAESEEHLYVKQAGVTGHLDKALWYATTIGLVEMVKHFLQLGANQNRQFDIRSSYLHKGTNNLSSDIYKYRLTLTKGKCIKVVKLLLIYGADARRAHCDPYSGTHCTTLGYINGYWDMIEGNRVELETVLYAAGTYQHVEDSEVYISKVPSKIIF